ncbi:MAG: hypothetical protein IPK34_11250 [Ramlibacter sp.]|nr:hypothetical protein [Ramlibacter sp.]
MFSLFASLTQMFSSSRAAAPAEAGISPARALMESADALAGLDPHQAEELRLAASAWLSVAR